MIWQDIVIMVGNLVMSSALLPSIRSKYRKPARLTCILSMVGIICFSLAFFTLGLWLSFSAVTASGILWLILLLQRRIN